MFTPADGGKPTAITVFDFKSAGVALAMYNTDEVRRAESVGCVQMLIAPIQSIRGFAHSSFKMALQKKLPLVSGNSIICIERMLTLRG